MLRAVLFLRGRPSVSLVTGRHSGDTGPVVAALGYMLTLLLVSLLASVSSSAKWANEIPSLTCSGRSSTVHGTRCALGTGFCFAYDVLQQNCVPQQK